MDIQTCLLKLGYVGDPFAIRQNNCLHCGNSYEHCPAEAVAIL